MKSPTVCLLALCAASASVHAQNAAPPFVFDGPPAAIVPVPFDGKSLALFNAVQRVTVTITLQNVKPSQMARRLSGERVLLRGSRDGIPLHLLPSGIEQILPLDNTNTLLVRGRGRDVEELKDTIAFLDRPQYVLEPDYVVYWIDPNAPEAACFRAEGFFRAQTNDDTAQLSVLMQRGDAQVIKTPLQVVPTFLEASEKTPLSFEVSPSVTMIKPSIPNAADGKKFESPMPLFPADPSIDPDFQQPNPSRQIAPPSIIYRDPFALTRGPAGFRFFNPDAPSGSVAVQLRPNTIWLLSAQALNLKPPSPRLSLALIQITPFIETLPPLNASGASVRP